MLIFNKAIELDNRITEPHYDIVHRLVRLESNGSRDLDVSSVRATTPKQRFFWFIRSGECFRNTYWTIQYSRQKSFFFFFFFLFSTRTAEPASKIPDVSLGNKIKSDEDGAGGLISEGGSRKNTLKSQ